MLSVKEIVKNITDNLVIKDITITINYLHDTVNITRDGGVIIKHFQNSVNHNELKEELKRKRMSFVQSTTFEETYLSDYQAVVSDSPKPKLVVFTIEA